MLSILVPKKHPRKKFPQICSLKNLKALLLFQAIKPNTGCKIQNSCTQDKKTALSYISFFLLVLIHSETEKSYFCNTGFHRYALKLYEIIIILCPRNTPGKISHRFVAWKSLKLLCCFRQSSQTPIAKFEFMHSRQKTALS